MDSAQGVVVFKHVTTKYSEHGMYIESVVETINQGQIERWLTSTGPFPFLYTVSRGTNT